MDKKENKTGSKEVIYVCRDFPKYLALYLEIDV